ncbi:hypothetical protein PUR28_02310 [Streptomyces sp. BE308]|uniref:hypothetical protein n=1 Tax=Streptomyces sp. BE308 TaxID=3002529 RepID=UPI002E79800C|nr:hypothetical protein [Streptomyces sp. BE308]MEE1789620.1 hypothetical protein [Streptomyces sp. BE308]
MSTPACGIVHRAGRSNRPGYGPTPGRVGKLTQCPCGTGPADWYERSRRKIVTGDYNGDGRDDLAALYGYSDLRVKTVKTITFTAGADGILEGDPHGWEDPTGWNFDRAHLVERHSEGLPVCPTIFGHGGYPVGADTG